MAARALSIADWIKRHLKEEAPRSKSQHLRGWNGVAWTSAVLAAAAVWLPEHPFVDERAHWPAVQSFAHGLWRLDPAISTWPTANALIGWILGALGLADSLVAGRLIVVAFAILGAVAFLRLAEMFDADSAPLKTAQFFLSPVVLPFAALVYTDVPALICLLWAALAAMRRQAWLMIGAGALACAMRQSNLVWFLALFALFLWRWRESGRPLRLLHLAAGATVVAAWLAAVWWQGGIAAGVDTQGDHPGGLRGMPNIWFALMVAAIIYLPYFLARLAQEHRLPLPLWQWLALGLAVALSFTVTHRFNLIPTDYFLRNDLLRWSSGGIGAGVFVVVVMSIAVLVFRTEPAKFAGLKIPFFAASAASLLPFWLIEQRYYLPVYAFFWAMRPALERRVEYAQLAFGLFASAWLLLRIASGSNFL